MKKNAWSGAILVAALLLSPAVRAADPVLVGSLSPFYGDVRGPECDATNDSVGMITAATAPGAVLYNHTRRSPPPPAPPSTPSPAPCNPLLAPDGHQLTLREFNAVQGTALAKCVQEGTHTVLRYSGLFPRGVYSLWLALPYPDSSPGFNAVGTLGKTSLSENFFVANANGEGVITRITPEQDLSVFGHAGPCLLDGASEIHIVIHTDQQTHGLAPGPTNTWVVMARFRIP